jgi:NAD(P)H-dependent flavin oxidoreductase YrpB (nitropropane dioxygenase family)
MLKTWVTEELGIEYPIIQGAMHWLSRAELVSAVANAGGLGIMAAGSFFTAEELRQEIRKTKNLTDKPFAVNFTIMPTRRQIVWEAYINVALEEGINIIETSGRSPEPYMEWLKASNVKVLHKAARIRDARTAERLGVDAVTIIGYESGGHPGMEDVTTLVRIPQAVETLEIPVIAGGGFANGRGLAAALALGAQGIVMGTRFMLSRECTLHPRIKELLLQTGEEDTVILERSIRNAVRVVNTEFAQKVLEMEARGATLEELIPVLDGNRVMRSLLTSGETNDSIIYCGQSVGLIQEILSVREIIDSVMIEAGEVMARLGMHMDT